MVSVATANIAAKHAAHPAQGVPWAAFEWGRIPTRAAGTMQAGGRTADTAACLSLTRRCEPTAEPGRDGGYATGRRAATKDLR